MSGAAPGYFVAAVGVMAGGACPVARSLIAQASCESAQLACPVLVMHGTQDAVRGYGEGEALADCTDGALVTFAGAGHFPHARDPVRVNLLIKQFADRVRR